MNGWNWREAILVTPLMLLSAYTVINASADRSNQSRSDDDLIKAVDKHLKVFYDRDLVSKRVARAEVGTVATGVVTYEEDDQSELDLDKDPCNRDMKVFTKPYKKETLKQSVTCHAKEQKKVQVTQQQRKRSAYY